MNTCINVFWGFTPKVITLSYCRVDNSIYHQVLTPCEPWHPQQSLPSPPSSKIQTWAWSGYLWWRSLHHLLVCDSRQFPFHILCCLQTQSQWLRTHAHHKRSWLNHHFVRLTDHSWCGPCLKMLSQPKSTRTWCVQWSCQVQQSEPCPLGRIHWNMPLIGKWRQLEWSDDFVGLGTLGQGLLPCRRLSLSVHRLHNTSASLSASTIWPLPPGSHYFLADAGYADNPQLLLPYCGIQYHLAEWNQASQK